VHAQLFGARIVGDVDVATAAVLGGHETLEAADVMKFDSFSWALIESFHVLAGEGWSSRMCVRATAASRSPRTSLLVGPCGACGGVGLGHISACRGFRRDMR
jgi:hypothetical protein